MQKERQIVIKNKKAAFEYSFIVTYTAGIMLTGTEVKSIREGKANLTDSFCVFMDEGFWVKNLHISEYSHGSYSNHEPRRMRKLLLNNHELAKIRSKLKEKGTTVIPVQLYFNERGLAKLDIAVAKGKKQFDKREDIKKKDIEREMGRKDI
jgi:SsrA-binding protein